VAVECQVFAQDVNALLRGWAAYFRHGHSARHLSRIRRYAQLGFALFISKEAPPQPPLRLSCDAQRATAWPARDQPVWNHAFLPSVILSFRRVKTSGAGCSTATVAQLNACGRARDCGRSGTGLALTARTARITVPKHGMSVAA
jgi:hypothetical protein